MMKSDVGHEGRTLARCGGRILKAISAVTSGLAISTAILVLALRVTHWFQPNLFPWTLKSAVPLILAGVAFACLQFAISRTRTQMVLGLVAAAAFILWGTEQFLPNRPIVPFIDDVVVFLFVFDISIAIYGHLKRGPNSVGNDLPFDAP
jgi:hypothetical protein